MHPSLAAAAEAGPIDLAMICVPAAACPAVLDDAARAGAAAAVICGGGFAEAGGPGVGYQAALADVVSNTGIRLLGPNTSGFLAPHVGVTASFVPGAAQVRPGRVAVVAASGGVNHALSFLLTEAGHGISLAVGIGNAVDISAPDVLDHLAADPHTSAVALHVESVADGPRLVDAVRRLSARKPVVALVVGRHDIGAFAASHTGALATSWRTTRAALAPGRSGSRRRRARARRRRRGTVDRPRPPHPRRRRRSRHRAGRTRAAPARRPPRAARPRPGAGRGDTGHARDPAAAPDLPGQPGRHRAARP